MNLFMNIFEKNMFDSFALTHSEPLPTAVASFIKEDHLFLTKNHFNRLLFMEQKRTKRSNRPFLLLMFDISELVKATRQRSVLDNIKTLFANSLRESDIIGWYDCNKVIGVMFTDMITLDSATIEAIISKIYDQFRDKLELEMIKKIKISFCIYPERNSLARISSKIDVQQKIL